ncbi:MAG: tetratricopeptide repeat protein [Roseobacter sp.]|nr:tetratricopeptide repeat protein [Roseobacter sp.]
MAAVLLVTVSSNSHAFLPFGFGVGGTPEPRGIVSDRPFFDPAKGLRLNTRANRIVAIDASRTRIQVIGERVAAFRDPTNPPTVAAFVLVQSKGRYVATRFPDGDNDKDTRIFFQSTKSSLFKGRPFSIHRSMHQDVYIAQVEVKIKDKTEYDYYYIRLPDGMLAHARRSTRFKPETIDPAKWNGSVESKPRRVRVTDERSLHFMLDEQDKSRRTLGIVPERPGNSTAGWELFRLTGDIAAARIDVMSALCLFLAESPLDPGRRRGPLDHAVPSEYINTDQSWMACGTALEAGAQSPSVRFSATRVLNALARANKDEALAERSKTMLTALRDEGYLLAEPALALRHFGTPGQARDVPKAVEMLRQSAAKGNAASAYLLGRGYRLKWFNSVNAREAERHLRQAINGGIVEAYSELGRIVRASGAENSESGALALFAAGAEAGDPESAMLLGMAQYRSKAYESAFKNIKEAAREGVPHALYMEGFMHFYGKGTRQSDLIAKLSFQKAVKLGHRPSKAELGMMMCTDRAGSPSAGKRAEGVAMLKEAEAAGVRNAAGYLKKCL